MFFSDCYNLQIGELYHIVSLAQHVINKQQVNFKYDMNTMEISISTETSLVHHKYQSHQHVL